MSLPALLLDRDLRIDAPIEALTFLVTLDKSIMLTQIVSDTRLPTTCCGLELVPRILLLDVVVNLLKVHLASRGGRDGFVDQHHVIC